MMLVSACRLCREYARGEQRFMAVDNASLNMAPGEFVCVMGRSGSGKTTLLGLLAGLISPTSGSVSLAGEDIGGLDDAGMSQLRNNFMGYVPQGSGLLPNLTALDNCRLPWFLGKRRGHCAAKAWELLDNMGVGHLAHSYPAAMSGGELRRVVIARAMINAPRLIMADEPTSDLDVRTTAEIMDLLLKLNRQGTALLIVTHDSELSRYAARTLHMEGGKLSETPPV